MSANLDWALLDTAFLWVARTSLAALPLAVLALVLGAIPSCRPHWRVWLAALFFLRLALPDVPHVSWRSSAWVDRPPVILPLDAPLEKERSENATMPAAAKIQIPWLQIGGGIWLAGFGAVITWMIRSHLRLSRHVARSSMPAQGLLCDMAEAARKEQGVRQPVPLLMVHGMSTMAVFGWFRPVLLVPEDLERRYSHEQLRGMLLHEFNHVRRKDVLWTWLALSLCAVHWFNPVAWLAFRRFCADRELICDASAVDRLSPDDRYHYGDALLRSLEISPLRSAPSLAPFFRIHPEIKQRLLMITRPSSPTVLSRMAALLLAPAVSLVAFTAGQAQTENQQPKAAPEQTEATGRSPEQREAEGKRRSPERDGERARTGPRDGEERKAGPRDGERKKEGMRDGERPRNGARDGDRSKEGVRDGERPRRGAREEEGKKRGEREGDSNQRKSGAREGDRPREGAPRDGDGRRSGPRDGEGRKEGVRDGDARKSGARDGEDGRKPREGEEGRKPREGEGRRSAERD